ncbi:MAG: hypothetical protein QOF73_2065 [Thermomicrobiales bacterium]|nr:hypothetical protein [Thermomicrobiales bacterium]
MEKAGRMRSYSLDLRERVLAAALSVITADHACDDHRCRHDPFDQLPDATDDTKPSDWSP